MAVPTIKVEMAPNGNAFTVPVSYTDVSSYMRACTVRRGRSKAGELPAVGGCSLLADNRTRDWDPSNTSGAFNPLRLRRQMRVQMNLAFVDYPLFYGYTSGYSVQWDVQWGTGYSQTQVQLQDAIPLLAEQTFTGSIPVGTNDEYGPHIGEILDHAEVGWPAAWRAGMSSTGYHCVRTIYTKRSAWDAILEAVRTAVADPGNICIEANGFVSVNPGAASGLTFGEAVGEIGYTAASLESNDDVMINRARVTRVGGAEQVADNATSQQRYGIHEDSRQTIGLSDANSLSLATDIVTRYQEPLSRPEGFRVRPGGSTARWTAVLSLDIGDTFTMKRNPPGGGSAYSKTMKVLGVEWDIPEAIQDSTVLFYLEEQ
jgi:hypothetical protein